MGGKGLKKRVNLSPVIEPIDPDPVWAYSGFSVAWGD